MTRPHQSCWNEEYGIYQHVCYKPSGRDCVEDCGAEAGTWWTPYWCPDCDVIRLDRITRQLEAMTKKEK